MLVVIVFLCEDCQADLIIIHRHHDLSKGNNMVPTVFAAVVWWGLDLEQALGEVLVLDNLIGLGELAVCPLPHGRQFDILCIDRHVEERHRVPAPFGGAAGSVQIVGMGFGRECGDQGQKGQERLD